MRRILFQAVFFAGERGGGSPDENVINHNPISRGSQFKHVQNYD